MLADAMRALYGYHNQATRRLLAAAAALTPEQFVAPAAGEQRSVRDTLLHLIAAQRGWVSWWDGALPGEQAYRVTLDAAEFPTVAAIRPQWEAVERQTQAFLDALADGDMQREYVATMPNGDQTRMILWQMLLHVANHGTQHRSELAAMLTAFGHSPGALDLLWYFAPLPQAR